MSGNEKLERELESFLAEENSRVAALYRKLPRQEPDAKLDASVLAMASNAVTPRRSRNRWLPAMSAAAVLLVVAGIAYRAGPQVWNDRGTQTAHPASNAADEAKTAVISPASPPATPPAQEPAREMTADLGVNAAKPVSAPAKPAPTDALARRKAVETPRLQSPPPVPQAFPQPQAAASEILEKRADKSAAASAPEREQKDGTPGRAEAVSGALKAAATQPGPAPVAAMSAVPNDRLYPEHWISNIQKMLRDNRRDEAIRSLEDFRKQYPNYQLPDDLRDLK
jgi:hypothetical protein